MIRAMKWLLVLRHAKAEEDTGSIRDHERRLTKKGTKAARRMGELMRAEGLLPDRVLSSTAERARATAEQALHEAGLDVPIELVSELYLAEPPAYFDALRRFAGAAERVLVVGHNPGIETLIFRLTGAAEHMSTGALAHCEIAIADWQELTPNVKAKLVAVYRPKELAD